MTASTKSRRSGSQPLAERLSGGDRRSIGAANAVAAEVLSAADAQFPDLWGCLTHADPVVRMRAADALEKVSRSRPELFAPHRKALLTNAAEDGTKEVRWHLIAIAARLETGLAEARRLVRHLDELLHTDQSRIVRVTALDAAASIAARHAELQPAFSAMLHWAAGSNIASLQARARKLGSR